ncbi:Hypp474 [Branchiostoma lanceolatum]|uniref:Hypp474 protein n=1 Tax=Branchiostoma lanceolatum TaxID=7740 RepID=A0A8J9W490_BRALA|nr:Hypp474 [Branchiostoma lanceolatum]
MHRASTSPPPYDPPLLLARLYRLTLSSPEERRTSQPRYYRLTAFLHCFDETESSGRAERGLAVLRSLVLGQYIATVLPFCGTVNHGDKLRDVNKNAAGECTILDVQHCFAKAVFSQSEPWTPCLVQPLAFECYLHECLGPMVGPVPNIIGNVIAYHLNSTFTAPGMCAHMETTQISNEYDYLY